MSTTTDALADQHIRADIQDLVYSVQHGARRHATLDDTMGPLMLLVQRYADLQIASLRADRDALHDAMEEASCNLWGDNAETVRNDLATYLNDQLLAHYNRRDAMGDPVVPTLPV